MISFIFVFMTIMSSASPTSFASEISKICDEVILPSNLSTLAAQDSIDYLELFKNELSQLNLKVLSGAETPSWQDFAALDPFISEIHKIFAKMPSGSHNDFRLRLEKDNFFRQNILWNKNPILAPAGPFKPTELELRFAYREKLKDLPNPIREILFDDLPPLPKNDRNEHILAQAIDLVRRQKQLLAELYSTSGYTEISQVEQLSNPTTLNKLRDNDFEIAMSRPDKARWWIPKVGFHNQYVTGSSRGYFGNEGRNATEATLLGLSADEYKELDNDLKPKYGFLAPPFRLMNRANSQVNYGPDTYIFKKKNILYRTTFTLGDSLNRIRYVAPDWKQGIAAKPKFWNEIFLPMSSPEFLAPFIGEEWRADGRTVPQFDQVKIGMNKDLVVDRSHEYIESQIFGPLTLDDVEKFIFTNDPPTGDFLNALRLHKIPIFQFTEGGQIKSWKG